MVDCTFNTVQLQICAANIVLPLCWVATDCTWAEAPIPVALLQVYVEIVSKRDHGWTYTNSDSFGIFLWKSVAEVIVHFKHKLFISVFLFILQRLTHKSSSDWSWLQKYYEQIFPMCLKPVKELLNTGSMMTALIQKMKANRPGEKSPELELILNTQGRHYGSHWVYTNKTSSLVNDVCHGQQSRASKEMKMKQQVCSWTFW